VRLGELDFAAQRHRQRNQAAERMSDEMDGFARLAHDPFQRFRFVNNGRIP
jgi:hypothetical protein